MSKAAKNNARRVGFMQGRLSPMVDGKIQAFPSLHWREELPQAQRLALHLMEWTLDQAGLYENPLMTQAGQHEIVALVDRHDLSIPSLTGDCFMQAPYWKTSGAERANLLSDFKAIISACGKLGVKMIVVPLVDNGRLDDLAQKSSLLEGLEGLTGDLIENHVKVVFESDFGPQELARFAEELDPGLFGINYDIGNSAALGFNPREEFACYATRIANVHVKDRIRGGTTVPLGTGSADFDCVFSSLAETDYKGNLILQTARAKGDDHDIVLRRYLDMTLAWMAKHEL